MRIEVQNKAFELGLQHGFLTIREISEFHESCIKFSPNMTNWVLGILKCCSNLSIFSCYREFESVGCIIESGVNDNYWFLKLCIQSKGSIYSIFVPALDCAQSDEPWKPFIDACIDVVGAYPIRDIKPVVGKVGVSRPEIGVDFDVLALHSRCVDEARVFKDGVVDDMLVRESVGFPSTRISPFSNSGVLKDEIDELLELENLGFPSPPRPPIRCCNNNASDSITLQNIIDSLKKYGEMPNGVDVPKSVELPEGIKILDSKGADHTVSFSDFEKIKIWNYRDPQGIIQGPFSLLQLHKWWSRGSFPSTWRIWRTDFGQNHSMLVSDLWKRPKLRKLKKKMKVRCFHQRS